MVNRWQLHRAGILNFWYYDDQEFQFADGKLLLRGSNGSGKSVTMQSLVTVLLDGRKSPDRLDPFGSKARRMEDYLLGEKELVDRDERTGYLYLEYRRRNSRQFITTGMGLRARRNHPLDSWYFIILDNRRIGEDLHLYKTGFDPEDGSEQKIPLTRKELEHRLDKGGQVVRTQGEYMELVNRHIFGFNSLDDYKELIELLLQLRSPKLSRDFKPTVVYEILNQSLPPLSDEELRPLSDTIETMDQLKQQLEQMQREHSSLQKLCRQYDQYNRYVLAEKARIYLEVGNKKAEHEQEGQRLQEQLQQQQQEIEAASGRLEAVEREKEVLQHDKEQLQQHDVFKAEEERQQLLTDAHKTREEITDKQSFWEQKQGRKRHLQQQIDHAADRLQQMEGELQQGLAAMTAVAGEAKFAAHQLSAAEFEQAYRKDFQFDLWKKETEDYRKYIEKALDIFQEYKNIDFRFREADRELAERKKDLDGVRLQETKLERAFLEQTELLREEVHRWVQQNRELTLEQEAVQQLSRRLLQLFRPLSFQDVLQPVRESFDCRRGELHQAVARHNQLVEQKLQAITDKQEELKRWRETKDPEPERHPETGAARRQLQAEKIPFLPFYAAVEFKSHVTPEEKERIEAAVTETGLLDALIIPESSQSKATTADRVITPRPVPLGYTLADYLTPTPMEGVAVSATDIENVLRSISVYLTDNESETALQVDGSYRIGILRGQAPSYGQAVYIGREARRRHRQQQIERMEQELAELNRQLAELQQGKERLQERIRVLEQEYHNFPSPREAETAFEQLKDCRSQVRLLVDAVDRLNEKAAHLREQRENIKRQLRVLTAESALPEREDAYRQAREQMNNYQRLLQQLEIGCNSYQGSLQMCNHYRENLKELHEDITGLERELHQLQGRLEQLELARHRVEMRLEEMGAEEIRRRIDQVIARLQEIDTELKVLPRKIERGKASQQQIINQISDNDRDLSFFARLAELWQEIYTTEFRRRLVYDEDKPEREGIPLAREVYREFRPLVEGNTREALLNRFNQVFYAEQAVLVEYRLTQEEVPGIENLPEAGGKEIYLHRSEQLKQVSGRMQVMMEFGGQRQTPYQVLQQIESEISALLTTLDDKDRELFEEIIMNNVGRIIRKRINKAQAWVEEIDKLMQERDTSSGLTFSLRWKPRAAESEEELDTYELVQLLQSDPRLLKEEDMNRITGHFRAKIGRAKNMVAETGFGETLHQVIKQILDYRQWFSFTLYFRWEGEQKRELTNHMFFRLSGGEKAMAMYIPLFSAAYSRYRDAREDAPRIISLDEAFAGVDERNIRDMFNLMEQLGFNFIINSQSLWGDYDTVASLSIAELLRDKNAPFVTVVRYLWDGKVRHLQHRQEA